MLEAFFSFSVVDHCLRAPLMSLYRWNTLFCKSVIALGFVLYRRE